VIDHNPDVRNYLNNKQEDPLDLITAIESEYKYFRVLQSLFPKCRKVFEMSRLEGKKNHEIAEELKISKRTVEKHISVALKIFRKNFDNNFNE
jgi:RNA polymerase sigma-70 factor (ECF subfamily)